MFTCMCMAFAVARGIISGDCDIRTCRTLSFPLPLSLSLSFVKDYYCIGEFILFVGKD